jgi:glucose/arabinose dehydrogenase
MRRLRLSALGLAGCAVTVLAVGPASAATGLADPIPAPIPDSQAAVGLQVVADGMTSPVEGKPAPGDKRRLYVIDQTGKIMAVDTRGRKPATLVADLSGLVVSTLAKVIPGLPYDERGLLGIAFPADFKKSHLAYTFETEDVSAPADFTTLPAGTAANSQSVVREWTVLDSRGSLPHFDMTTGRELLRIDKPQFNHNGGDLAFGPDGDLYISVGDGGAADDQGPGHVAGGNGQSLAEGNVLGKILRIDPRGHNSANGQYGVPADNPFVNNAGADEIWAYGFRNPYRFSFDSRTGMLTAGDVGQNDIEEVDAVTRGGNYGWPIKEGTFLFDNGGAGNGFVTADSPGSPADLIDPVAEYDHTAPGGVRCGGGSPPSACQGIAIVGGYTYRGDDLEGLRGAYIAGDYSQAFAAPLGRLWVVQGGVLQSLRISGSSSLGIAVFGFAQDGHGELYVLGNKTGLVAGTTGQVVRLTSSEAEQDD